LRMCLFFTVLFAYHFLLKGKQIDFFSTVGCFKLQNFYRNGRNIWSKCAQYMPLTVRMYPTQFWFLVQSL